MTLTKGALTVTSLATALLFGGGLYLFMNMDSMAKTVAENYASRSLGVPVTIGSMEVSLQNKTVHVKNVQIANAPGYQAPHAMTVGSIQIKASTLGRELLEFQDVSVSDANVYLDITPQGTNLTDIRKNLQPQAANEAPTQGQQSLKVILDKLVMNGTIHPNVSFLEREFAPIALPPVTMNNLGRGQNGVSSGTAISQIWKEITEESIRAANQQGLLDGLSMNVLKDAGLGDIEIIKDQFGDQVNKLTKGIQNMFE